MILITVSNPLRFLTIPTAKLLRLKFRAVLTPLEPQSRFGDKLLENLMVCPQNGTAVLKGLNAIAVEKGLSNR